MTKEPTTPTAPVTTPPSDAGPLAWLAGAWHGAQLDERWVSAAGAWYGVALGDTRFGVTVVAKTALVFYAPTGPNQSFTVTSVQPNRIDATAAHRALRIERSAGGLTGELNDPPNPPQVFSFVAAKRVSVPELEAADRAFAADSAARGAAAWSDRLAPGGSLQQGEDRLTDAAAVKQAMAAELASGQLEWSPTASGRRGDLGFTVGEWHFRGGAVRMNGSYCTVWKRVGDRWLMLFDVGRDAVL